MLDNLFIMMISKDPRAYFMWVILVMFSICCHEYMHARVALWQGDSTATDQGHLTLNPIKQMGPLAIVMLMVIGFSWGQVPVNPLKMRHRYSDALVSFAGPFTNLMLFLIFAIGAAVAIRFNPYAFYSSGGPGYGAIIILTYGAVLNIALFILNMLPIPILDGFNIFSFVFPWVHNINQELKNGITVILFILVFTYSGIILELGFLITRNMVHIIGVVLKTLT